MGLKTGLGSLSLLALATTLNCLAFHVNSSEPLVDLGYAKYEGSYDGTYDLNVFKG